MAGVGVDDVAGGGSGGNAAAAPGADEALPSGLWFTRKKARAAVPSVKTPMSAMASHFLAEFALAGTTLASGCP